MGIDTMDPKPKKRDVKWRVTIANNHHGAANVACETTPCIHLLYIDHTL